jgi:dTDP-4-dehydrorhamnose 3,5-epimerase
VKITKTKIDGVLVIEPAKYVDDRGFFSDVFKQAALVAEGIDLTWIQDNHSFSAQRGVVRGLHFQSPPMAQAKLLRVVRGAIFDVAVDLRRASPSYGQHVSVKLSADNWQQVLIPVGCAHGFCTLSDETEVIYKVTSGYSPAHEGGLRWNDPALAIDWPIPQQAAILSHRDSQWPGLEAFDSPF